MEMQKSFIVDENGNPKAVVIDYYLTFKKVEELLLDAGLASAMGEAANDEELDIEKPRRVARYIDNRE